MRILICLALLAYTKKNIAQDSTKILIKADQLVSEVLTPEKIYQYAQFSPGKIIFMDRTSMNAVLNYNYLNGEIEFIAATKDTLAIAKEQMLNIKQIILNGDTFYYNNGYMQQVMQTSFGKIAKKKTLVVLERKKIGAYDRPSSTTNLESIGYFRDYFGSTTVTSVRAPENITLGYVNQFYLGDQYNAFLPANKKNLQKIFFTKKEMINTYLRENDVDFRNIDHLKKMLLYLN